MTPFPIEKFSDLPTPFYFYDTALLRKTIDAARFAADRHGYHIHYAVKANHNHDILKIIANTGLGADCVSGGEVSAACDAGIPANKIVFAGVGKTDSEINVALDHDIFCFNVESLPELYAINELAAARGMIARVAFRVNPNVDAHTHAGMTTGMAENKFGIAVGDLMTAIGEMNDCDHLKLIGLHFHIGSMITDMEIFRELCGRVNEIQDAIAAHGVQLEYLNLGGGLGIDYRDPDKNSIAEFGKYFDTFAENLKLRPGQTVHFELGRSIVAQMGTLISRVTYVKHGATKKFVILDAGMNDLVRPAMYGSYHKIENISRENDAPDGIFDVVGPICESSDVFQKDAALPTDTARRDLIAIRSAGAYGRVMASNYNLRDFAIEYLF